MADQGIFDSLATAAGQNSNSWHIPERHDEAVKWIVAKLSKLTADRRMTAETLSDIKRAAKNDGYPPETIAEAMRLKKMSPEKRDKRKVALSKAFGLYGLEITVLAEDPKPDKLLNGHLAKMSALEADRREIGEQIRDLCKHAKSRGFDVPKLKQIVKLSKMSPEDRADWFAQMDNLGAILQYW